MKKCAKLSLVSMILGLAGGVFYREFTKGYGFTGRTMLGNVHPHFLGLGMLFFLLVGLLCDRYELDRFKSFRSSLCVYSIGLTVTGVIMWVRGAMEVAGKEIAKGLDGALSGIAGLGHAVLAVGLVLFFVALFKALKK